MQQLASYRSDASGLALEETPRSGDGGGDLEHKVRGGLSRSVSLQAVPSPLGAHSLPAHPSHASLAAWEQRLAGSARRPAGSSGRFGDRLASSSSLGSPGAQSTPALSPQHHSPAAPGGGLAAVAATSSGGYSRVLVSPGYGHSHGHGHHGSHGSHGHGGTRVQALPPLALADLQAGGTLAAALHVRSEVVAHGSHLSRTTTDTAGLLQAVSTLERASATTGARRPA